MNGRDLMALATDFQQQGDIQSAVRMWEKVTQVNDPSFVGAAHLNLFNVLRSQNNLRGALQKANDFLDSPVTGRTLELVPQIKAQVDEIERQLGIKK